MLLKETFSDPLQRPSTDDKSVRLVSYCGRSEDSLRLMLENIRDKYSKDFGLHALLSQTSSQSYMSQPYRGYMLLSNEEEATTVDIQVCGIVFNL